MEMRITAFVRLENGEVGKSLVTVEALDPLHDQLPSMRQTTGSLLGAILTAISMSECEEHVGVAIECEATELLMTLHPARFAAPRAAPQRDDLSPGMA
jgi:hypothetical protein